MVKVIVIGSGNVAQHLITAFQNAEKNESGISLIQVFARKRESLAALIPIQKVTNQFSELLEADLYIIAVSDDAIESVSSELLFKNRLVAHTSGSVPLTILNNNNRKAVFYPLQSFTKGAAVDFRTIPLCLEAENSIDFQMLSKVGKLISDHATAINSQQRKALHVAAVFANNFSNHLYQIANDICKENQVPFSILKPLIQETAKKIVTLDPEQAQTGPANRNDQITINAHEAFIKDDNQLKIYKLLTESIQHNGKKL
ncbi:Rossmann-like and DUF2520 domain-containing protein [Flavobacterium frigidarium]|uniref:Rossmann-like and DUF2520 domain-containing protein n=1 Tax=Flavobacterium frigidarium TaxID=99286 RepID=UPI0003F837F4|nr:Rossmann-like and DUF2520 domain-containing protein [Flavobacterium frigidarium]